LGAAYEEAWRESADGDDAHLWDATTADGLTRCAAANSGGSNSIRPRVLIGSVPPALWRIGARIGVLPGPELVALDEALRLHLAL
jgi:hypothetical protein